MKKHYIKPSTKIVPIEVENVIATSDIPGGGPGTPSAKQSDREDFDDIDW